MHTDPKGRFFEKYFGIFSSGNYCGDLRKLPAGCHNEIKEEKLGSAP